MSIPSHILVLWLGQITQKKKSLLDLHATKHKKKRLEQWKGKNMTFAGRVTLIKSVIIVVPLIFMSMFKVLLKI